MAAYNKFEVTVENMWQGIHDFRSTGDTCNIYLSNTAPNASTHQVKADIAEIATGNGYTGPVDTQNNLSRSGGTASVAATDITITAAGGSIGPFRYVIYYNDTPTSPADPLLGWWDNGTAITLNDGDSFTVDFAAAGTMQLT